MQIVVAPASPKTPMATTMNEKMKNKRYLLRELKPKEEERIKNEYIEGEEGIEVSWGPGASKQWHTRTFDRFHPIRFQAQKVK